MRLALVLLFIVVPIAELAVIIQVGELIGVWWTIALLVADSILGAVLMRSQGRAAWRRFNEAVGVGRVPAREVLDGALVIFGGALLLTPGFITDILGLVLLIPPTRAHRPRGAGAAAHAPHGDVDDERRACGLAATTTSRARPSTSTRTGSAPRDRRERRARPASDWPGLLRRGHLQLRRPRRRALRARPPRAGGRRRTRQRPRRALLRPRAGGGVRARRRARGARRRVRAPRGCPGSRRPSRSRCAEWTVRFDDGAAGFELTFQAAGPPAELEPSEPAARAGGMTGYVQLCHVHGTARAGDSEHEVRGPSASARTSGASRTGSASARRARWPPGSRTAPAWR